VTKLQDKTCVVTGSTSGIGEALTIGFAQAGAHVWAVGRARGRLDAVSRKLPDPSLVRPVLADLALVDEAERAASEIARDAPALDVLVHCAGAIQLGFMESVEPEDFDRQYAVNLRAPFVLTRRLLPALRAAHGRVVFVNSSAALRAGAENATYAATKAGLKALADGLRDEVNSLGVRVFSVFVGRTASPMQSYVHEYEGRSYEPASLLQPDDVVQVVMSMLELPDTAEMTDVSIRPMRKRGEL